MRRCPTGGTDDFGGCWRSRNSIHIYIYPYIHISIYIYIIPFDHLWPILVIFLDIWAIVDNLMCVRISTPCCLLTAANGWSICNRLMDFIGATLGTRLHSHFKGLGPSQNPWLGSIVQLRCTWHTQRYCHHKLPLTGHRAAVGLRRGSKHQHGGGWRMGCWACYWMLLGTMMMMVCLDRAPMETQRFLIVDTPQMSGSSASLVWSPSIWPRPRSTRW